MEIPRHWRLKKQRYALQGKICPHCGEKQFPPRIVCLECGQNGKNRKSAEGLLSVIMPAIVQIIATSSAREV